jgi:hypothetical protein
MAHPEVIAQVDHATLMRRDGAGTTTPGICRDGTEILRKKRVPHVDLPEKRP